VSRLIDIQPNLQELPAELVVGVGDVLRFAATGGRVRTGTAVELAGTLTDSVLGTNGTVLTPAGPPNSVLFRAIGRGRSVIDVITGDPWRSATTLSITVRVEG
jgi:hypothetical protein